MIGIYAVFKHIKIVIGFEDNGFGAENIPCDITRHIAYVGGVRKAVVICCFYGVTDTSAGVVGSLECVDKKTFRRGYILACVKGL